MTYDVVRHICIIRYRRSKLRYCRLARIQMLQWGCGMFANKGCRLYCGDAMRWRCCSSDAAAMLRKCGGAAAKQCAGSAALCGAAVGAAPPVRPPATGGAALWVWRDGQRCGGDSMRRRCGSAAAVLQRAVRRRCGAVRRSGRRCTTGAATCGGAALWVLRDGQR